MQKVLNLVLIRQEVEGEKCSKTFFVVLERQNMQNQTMFKLYSHDNKSIYSTNPKDIPKSEKKIYEKLYTKKNLTVIKNRTILHTLSTIFGIVGMSNKLNKNLYVIFLELILSFLLCIRLNMETSSFT